MGDRKAKRSSRQTEGTATSGIVKVTLRLDELTAKRLAVESAMTNETQSHIANRVLGEYLSAWRLPSKIGGVAIPADQNESAA